MFWFAHTAGWLAFSMSTFLTFLPQSEFATAVLLVMKLVRGAIGFTLTLALRQVLVFFQQRHWRLPAVTGLALAAAVTIGPVWLWSYSAAVDMMLGVQVPALRGGFVRASLDFSFVLALWASLYIAAQVSQDREQARLEAMAAQQRARDAKLEALRYQLHPHFIFNALNSIRALIPESAVDARRIVTEFAELLRYTLREMPPGPIRLGDELNAARRYVAVERIRFEDSLEVEWHIDPAAEGVCIPGFTLQPLIENALRHGRAAGHAVLSIHVRAALKNRDLTIDVVNTGTLQRSDPGTGVALLNVRQRLDHYYPDRARLMLREEGGWVHAAIHITEVSTECAP